MKQTFEKLIVGPGKQKWGYDRDESNRKRELGER